jgi:hypothetical protein
MYGILGLRLEFLMGRNHTTKYSSDVTVPPISVMQIFYNPKATRGHEPISYRGALLSARLHAIVYVFTQFA